MKENWTIETMRHFNRARKAFDLLNLNIKYEFDKVFNWKAPQLAVHFVFSNLLDDEIWLPATGQFKNYTLPNKLKAGQSILKSMLVSDLLLYL